MKLSLSDEKKLKAAHPDLVKVVRRAAEITACPFVIGETGRSIEQQKKNVAKGVSQTLRSRHIIGKSGVACAVDLLAAPDGKTVTWAWPPYYKVAEAMKKAAKLENITLEWGGCWDRTLNDLGGLEKETAGYVLRQKKRGKKAFLDGPHFQLPWDKYPG